MIPRVKLLTASEVAEWLGISSAWVRAHAEGRRPVLPGMKLGRVWRFDPESVQRWLRQLEEAACTVVH